MITRCRYCDELCLGNRDGIGLHLSSLISGLAFGAFILSLLWLMP